MEPADEYNCLLCNVQCNSTKTLQQHYESAAHQRRVKASIDPPQVNNGTPAVSGDEGTNAESTGNGAPGFSISQEELDYCSICDITFNHPTPARQHYLGAKHLQKKMKLQQPKQEGSFASDCKICNKFFVGQLQADAHFASKKHMDKVEAANKPPTDPENFGECTLCSKVFPTEIQAKSHYESKKHLEKVKAAENPPEKKEPFGECTLCAKFFPFELQAKAHYESKKHLQKVRARDIAEGKIVEDAPPDAPDSKPVAAPTLFGKCDLCQKKFPGEAQAASHYASKKHIQKAELEKLRSSQKEAADDGEPVADAVSEEELKSMDMIAIAKHVSKTMNCPFCKKTFSGYQPVKDHLSSGKHVARVNMVKLNPELSLIGSPTSKTTNALGSVCEDISVDECGPTEEQKPHVGEVSDESVTENMVHAMLKEARHNAVSEDVPIKKEPLDADVPIKNEPLDTDNSGQPIKTRKRALPVNEEPSAAPPGLRQSKRRNFK